VWEWGCVPAPFAGADEHRRGRPGFSVAAANRPTAGYWLPQVFVVGQDPDLDRGTVPAVSRWTTQPVGQAAVGPVEPVEQGLEARRYG
jgi:hypothetical protein